MEGYENLAVLVGTALVGLWTHELLHYAACRAYDAAAKPKVYYRNLAEWGPAIRTELRHHTPRTLRVVSLAPLAMLVPVAVVYLYDPALFGASTTGIALAMWTVAAFPSPADLKNAYRAGELKLMNEVTFGTHPAHAAAEGI